ncbi:hypothetical protein ACFVSS_17365 [Peribacillus butanolivorans]|uniref:hypothetical protein n=1 Tax=Peribacillus butanolivorans TaxID=421767 RepID=UPI0036DCF23F
MLTERLKRVFSQQANGIDYAFLLAPVPVFAYLISLAHQYGELIFYGYPSYFLEIETSLVIKNTLVVIILCVVASFLFFQVSRFLIEKNLRIFATIISIGAQLAVFSVYHLYVPDEYKNVNTINLLMAAFLSLLFLLERMYSKSYIFAGFLVIIFIAIVSIEIGYSSTAYKTHRYIINKSDHTSMNKRDDTYPVIKTYKDSYLIAPIDLLTKEVSPAFELVKMSKDDESEIIERKKIGLITVKKVHKD